MYKIDERNIIEQMEKELEVIKKQKTFLESIEYPKTKNGEEFKIISKNFTTEKGAIKLYEEHYRINFYIKDDSLLWSDREFNLFINNWSTESIKSKISEQIESFKNVIKSYEEAILIANDKINNVNKLIEEMNEELENKTLKTYVNIELRKGL